MVQNFNSKLAGQIGESAVVSELGRRGIIATSFAGNVPDIDILAYKDGITRAIQVKSWRSGDVSFNAKRFMIINFDGERQSINEVGLKIDPNLIYIFVNIGRDAGSDRFFIMIQSELQKCIVDGYSKFLFQKGGVRPKNPATTHTAVRLTDLLPFENRWQLIESAFSSDNSK